MRLFRLFLLLAVSYLTLSATPPSEDPDAVVGKWLSSKKRNQVQIYKQGNKYYGKLVWLLEPNDPDTQRPKVDKENPDANLRNRPLMNMQLIKGLVYKGNNTWGEGEVYNPEDGRTYGCEVVLRNPNTVDMRGYIIGFNLVSKTRTWTRVP